MPVSDAKLSIIVISASFYIILDTIILPISVLKITSKGINLTRRRKLVRKTNPTLIDMVKGVISWYAYSVLLEFMWV